MPRAEAVIARSPEHCWRALTDVALLTAWLPGLRRARVVDEGERGLAREVHFEFSSSRTYSLVYAYDEAALTVRWEPRVGKRDAVRGFAQLDRVDGGTKMIYGIEQGGGRDAQEQFADDPAAVVAAFTRWVESQPVAMFTPRSTR